MKNKKGFTLIELIFTFALIALAGTIITVNMQGIVTSQNLKEYEKNIKYIEETACTLLDSLNFKEISGITRDQCIQNNGCDVSINTLVTKGYIDEELIINEVSEKVSSIKKTKKIKIEWTKVENTTNVYKKKCTLVNV